jgi:sec-independent protein translocase protein TatB
MFDIDAGKLLIIGVIALVVLGPKELPRVLRQIGSMLGKMRRMAAEFQGQFAEAMRQSEMEELKKSVEKVADSARVDINYDPVAVTNREIRAALEDKPSSAGAPAVADAAPQVDAPQIIDAAAFGPGTSPSGPPRPDEPAPQTASLAGEQTPAATAAATPAATAAAPAASPASVREA